MGASQSTGEGEDSKKPLSLATDMKTCYYDLLGVDRHAAEDEYALRFSGGLDC